MVQNRSSSSSRDLYGMGNTSFGKMVQSVPYSLIIPRIGLGVNAQFLWRKRIPEWLFLKKVPQVG